MTNIKKLVITGAVVSVVALSTLTAFAAPRFSLDQKKAMLNERVASGTLDQERADEIIKAIEENSANCDGTGTAKIGQKMGAKFGGGQGLGQGRQQGAGKGQCGMGLRNGSCIAQ